MIRAGHVLEEADNYEAVVLVDDDGFSFSLQRALQFDARDRETGMDTYCLVVEAGATHYGGIERWHREGRDLVVLTLLPGAADALGVPAEIDLEFDPAVLDDIDPIVRRLIGEG